MNKYFYSLLYKAIILLCVATPTFLKSQDCHMEGSVFINEIGNFGRDDEYVELVVVGSTSNPTAPVNLEGYIIDDNDFSLIDVGNQPGHIRLGDCFKAVLPGSIILIYNHSPLINPLLDNVNNPYSYLMQTKGACLIGCSYGQDQFQVRDYNCSNALPVTDTRKYMPMRNIGDVMQVRNPEGELVHAISWVDKYFSNDDPRTVYLADIPAQIPTMSGLCVSYDGRPNWNDRNNYNINGLPSATPGFPNSVENNKLINKIRAGAFSNVLKVDCVQLEPASQGKKDGKIKISIKGGTPSYGIYIDGADSFYDEIVGNLQKDYFFENLEKGTYKILVEDGGTCYQRFTIEIEETEPMCAGGCQRIGINPEDYCFYQWQPHPELTNIDWPEQKVCPEETTVFYLNVVDANGQSQVLNFKVEVKAADITPNPSIICPGQSVTLTVAGNNQSYKWYNGDTSPQIKVDQAGNYGVTVVDAEGCVRKGIANVLSASNPENIKKYFIANGFYQNTDYIIQSLPGKTGKKDEDANRFNSCVQYFANDVVSDMDNNLIDFENLAKQICNSGNFTNIYVTDNDNFCAHVNEIEAAMASSDKIGWFGLYHFGNESIIFYKFNVYFNDGYERVAKSDLKDYVNKFCPVWDREIEHVIGDIFETTFNKMVKAKYPNWFYNDIPDVFQSSPGGTNTRPDGLGAVTTNDPYAPKFLAEQNGGIFKEGIVWVEAKAKTRSIYHYKDDGIQLIDHIDNIRTNFNTYIGKAFKVPFNLDNINSGDFDLIIEHSSAHLVLVTTHPGRLSLNNEIRKFAFGDFHFDADFSVFGPLGPEIIPAVVFPQFVNLYNFAAWKKFDDNGCMSLIYFLVDDEYRILSGHKVFTDMVKFSPFDFKLENCNCP
jgi:hypothetical protein